ncbi:hypothetical protein [Lewinella sp.]|uniref:hypothetical protein n=1 Tax=Lewinella sp. TaxID=2004506 RepID=UPI003D69FEF7
MCNKAVKHDISSELQGEFVFQRQYSPEEYLWGLKSSKLLYIGVNPYSKKIGYNDTYSLSILEKGPGLNSYFSVLKKWIPNLHDDIGLEGGVAHTDLVRCYSSTFPLKWMKIKDFDLVFRNCRTYLRGQIEEMSKINLKFIIVSGRHPCWHVLDMFFPEIIEKNKIDLKVLQKELNGSQLNFVFLRQFMGRNDVSKVYRNRATELLKSLEIFT